METTDFYKAISKKGKEAMRENGVADETMYLAPLGWRNVRDAEERPVIEPDPAAYLLVAEALAMRERGRFDPDDLSDHASKETAVKKGNPIRLEALIYALSAPRNRPPGEGERTG